MEELSLRIASRMIAQNLESLIWRFSRWKKKFRCLMGFTSPRPGAVFQSASSVAWMLREIRP